MNSQRDELRHLVEEIPDSKLERAIRYLQFLQERGKDELAKKLASAALDDEPETEAERIGAEQARREIEAGNVLSTEKLKRELGLS